MYGCDHREQRGLPLGDQLDWGRDLRSGCGVVPFMDFPPNVYPSDPRLLLLTLAEARDAVRLLMLLADDSEAGREARDLAGELGVRLPAE